MPEDAADLLDAYLDDRLDADGARAFATRMHADPAFRAAFADQCRREVALRAVLKVQHQAQQVAATSARFRRRHLRRRRPGGERWALGASALLLIALAIAGTLAVRPHPDLTVIEVAAAVGSTHADDASRPYAPGDRLLAGDELQIGSAATLRHRASGATLELLGPGRIAAAADGLRLIRGQAAISVPPQHRRAFRMTTPQVEIFVIGTRFNVDADGERTSVEVSEGIVEVRWATGLRQLHAGESASWPPLPAPEQASGRKPGQRPEREPKHASAQPSMQVQVDPPGVRGFEFFNALSGATLPDGRPPARLAHARTPLAVRALTRGEVRSVRFDITGPDADERHQLIEQAAPFIYPGDDHAEVRPTWILEPGSYRVSAQGYSDQAGTMALGDAQVIAFVVSD